MTSVSLTSASPLPARHAGAAVRSLDLALTGVAVAVLFMPLMLRAVLGWWRTGTIFTNETRIGFERKPFRLLRFSGAFAGDRLAELLNVVRGDMSIVGPPALLLSQATRLTAYNITRFAQRPGLVCPQALRRRVGIAHDEELSSDYGELLSMTVLARLGLIARWPINQILRGVADWPTPARLSFFGIPICNTCLQEAMDWIVERARAPQKSLLAFANPHCLNIAHDDADYRRILAGAARVLADGIGIALACRLQRVQLVANLNGTDLFPHLCDRAAKEGLGLFLLGGAPGVAELMAVNIKRYYPSLVITGTYHGHFSAADDSAVIRRVNESGADILLVAMGVPKQEKWLAKHHESLTPPLRLGVGGLFDFYSGLIPRAPLWLREIGLEWVWRLLQEPDRMWRRYLIGNPKFLFRIRQQIRRQPCH